MASVGNDVEAFGNAGSSDVLSRIYGALKKTYKREQIDANFELHCPFVKSLKKRKVAPGQDYTWAVSLDPANGIGNNLADVIAGVGVSDSVARGTGMANFTAKMSKDYSVLNLDNEFIARAASPDAAFAAQFRYQVNGSLQWFGTQYARKIAGNGSGALAKIAYADINTPSGALYYTLPHKSMTRFFTKNTVLVVCDLSTTGVPTGNLAAGGTVTAVDRNTGIITVSGAPVLTAYSGSTSGLLLGARGVMGVVGSPIRTDNVCGVAGWIPTTVPTSLATVGLGTTRINSTYNRDLYPERLAGHRLTGSTAPIDDLLFELGGRMMEVGSIPDVCGMSFNTYAKIASRQWNKVMPYDAKMAAAINCKPLSIVTPAGQLPFMVDASFPDDAVYLLKRNTWEIIHTSSGVPAQITEGAGNGNAFQLDEDGVQYRWRAWSQLVCVDPYQNGVAAVSDTSFI
ncbi:MAG: hypothetical protein IPL79_20160 [Myxococcales bacterium]|nr:hypothetical protein [Myxococcales bacterium]